MPGELLIRARSIWTLDPSRPRATAVAIRGGRFLFVGDHREARRALSRPREIDLGEATVVPGLVDAHGHLLLLGQRARELPLTGLRTPEEILDRVVRQASASPAGSWIRGSGWDQNLFPGQQLPDRAELDRRTPRHPVFLERIDGHAAWVNGAALRITGIAAGSNDPEGGRILRRPNGEPTGVLVDQAMELVAGKIPRPSSREIEELLHTALRRCADAGLVAVHDAGLDLEHFQALERMDPRGELPVRVHVMARWGGPGLQELLSRGPRDGEWLALRSVKFFLDGALGSRGAALFDDYADEPGTRGLLTFPASLAEDVAGIMRLGYQPALHAIGDRANAFALDALARAVELSGRADLRPRIEHAQVLRAQDIARFGSLAIASMQPTHAVSDLPWAGRRLGEKRLEGAYAWRALKRARARLAFGSDFPIESVSPLLGIHAASEGVGEERRLPRLEAIEAFTVGAAWASFSEGERGRIAPGFRADLSAFDRDIVEGAPERLLEAKPVFTMANGVLRN